MTSNLTRKEAQERARLLTLDTYRVSLDVSGAPNRDIPTYDSVTTVTFTAAEDATTFIDIIADSVYAVSINGQDLDPASAFDGFRVTFPVTAGHNELTIGAKALYSRSGEGMHRFFDPADDKVYLYTQYEPTDARRVFANFDQPDLKAVFEFDVTAPSDFTVLSGGAAQDSEEVAKDITRHSFAPTLRQSSYITCVCAGHYVELTDTYTRAGAGENGTDLTIPLGLYARASLADHMDPESIFTVTKQGLDFFMDFFDYPYPWGKYDQIFVPEYNLGAMENPGLVTFTEKYIHRGPATRSELAGRTNTILHEMAHMWFGDLVTPKWWDDLWLKESFAEYMGAHASVAGTEYREAWTNFAVGRKAWAYTADQQSTTHPIVADIVDLEAARQNFDGITYAKGASVLKQLVAHVGVERFFGAARHYFRELAFSSATLDDLIRHLEKACGRDLSVWVNAWLKTTGPDVLLPELTIRDGVVSELAVVRDSVDVRTGRGVNRPHTLRVGLYSLRGEDLVRTDLIDLAISSPRTPVPEAAGRPAPDLILINDDDLTYAKVRLGATGTKTVLAHLSGLTDPLARALVWSMLWNAVRDAKLKVQDYLDAAALHGPKETEPAILATVLQQSRMAVENYLPDFARESARRAEAARAWLGLDGSEPGSDLQRMWARHALALSAADPQSGGRVRGLLDGDVTGLVVDPEMRWQSWMALAGLGQASVEDLDAELERDHTKTGVAHHMAALTARPDDAAKQEAYRRLRTPGELSNEHCLALIEGLRTPLGAQTFANLNGSYFDDLEQIWQEFPIEMAQRLVVGLFPDGDTAETADRWLASHQSATGGLTRMVRERRDAASRAETARDFNS